MRRSENALTALPELEAIIARSVVCRLGLSKDGQPYVVPVNFGYRPGALYFHSAPAGTKLSGISNTPLIASRK